MKKKLFLVAAILAFILVMIGTFISLPEKANKNPQISINTEIGNIILELYPEQAPITVANFLQYIDENRLEDASFYRTVTADNQPNSKVKIAVIQGGLYEDEHPMMQHPIIHENTEQTGLKHLDGVISMARNKPGTATSEFFICVGDQPSLDYGGKRNDDGAGFAAFGKVISGMDIVHRIHQSPKEEQMLQPRIKITSIKRVNN